MDAAKVTARFVLLVISVISGFRPCTGLTLCDNANYRETASSRRSSFPRGGTCQHNTVCVKSGRKCTFAKLSCQPGYSIYNPDIQGIPATRSCTGLTSEMMIEKSECYWKNMCTVSYPKLPVIIRNLDDDESCLGQCIQSLHVRSWQCIKDTLIHKMCDDTKTFEIDIDEDTTRHGVVRSHEAWPYLYTTKTANEDVPACNKTFHPHLLSNHGGFTRLALSVVYLDIQPQYENLRAVSKDKVVEFNTNRSPVVHIFPAGQKVVLSLERAVGRHSKDDSRIAGAGFVICFKFLKTNENPTGAEVCGQMFRGNRKGAKCIKCKYNKKKKGTLARDFCGVGEEGVRVYNVTLVRTKQISDGCSPWTMIETPCRKKRKPHQSYKRGSKGNKKRRRDGKKSGRKGGKGRIARG
ncbi:uncharacterized protein [Argopecten irradians]|uniref:uncharacterized protein n=1 Tax=Argopecten irradians TaxID=31199 RepID=UPI00372456F6